MELLSTEVLEKNESTDEPEINGDCDQTDQNSICENNEFSLMIVCFRNPVGEK